jgi:hypothetical protein
MIGASPCRIRADTRIASAWVNTRYSPLLHGRKCQILFALIFMFWMPHKGSVCRALQGQDEARRCSVRV